MHSQCVFIDFTRTRRVGVLVCTDMYMATWPPPHRIASLRKIIETNTHTRFVCGVYGL